MLLILKQNALKKNQPTLFNKIFETTQRLEFFSFYLQFIKIVEIFVYATKTQAPPTAFILSSADLEKYFALTMTGCFGRTPLPKSLW